MTNKDTNLLCVLDGMSCVLCINVRHARRMSGETPPDTTVTFWFHYFRWPRTPQPPSVASITSIVSKPRRTYRDALLSNLPVATEQDALLHETYLFV